MPLSPQILHTAHARNARIPLTPDAPCRHAHRHLLTRLRFDMAPTRLGTAKSHHMRRPLLLVLARPRQIELRIFLLSPIKACSSLNRNIKRQGRTMVTSPIHVHCVASYVQHVQDPPCPPSCFSPSPSKEEPAARTERKEASVMQRTTTRNAGQPPTPYRA